MFARHAKNRYWSEENPGSDFAHRALVGIGDDNVLQRQRDPEALAGDIESIVECGGGGDAAVEILDSIKERDGLAVVI